MVKKGELVAIRPEEVIEARFKLTSRQNDILDIVFTSINDDDDDKLEYTIDINKYKQLYNIQDKSNLYGDLKKAVKTFEGKGFRLFDKDKKNELYYPWFTKIQYKNGKGQIVVDIHQDLKNIFIEMKKRIYYNIRYTLNFNCIYSKRLYYYLKSFDDTGWRIDNLNILRRKLECPKSYEKYSLFKKFVLKPSHEEINGNSDISFEFEEIKTGRKVTSIKFIISRNVVKVVDKNYLGADTENQEGELELAVRKIIKEKISTQDVKNILEKARGDIDVIKEKYTVVSRMKEIKNLVGAMLTAIEQNWKIVNKKTISTFNNFEQRNYNFKDLEKKLLSNSNSDENDDVNHIDSKKIMEELKKKSKRS